MSKVPEYAILNDVFYLRPKSTAPLHPEEKWYDSVPVGKNKLSNMMKEMSIEAGFGELKTNHSLRATGATALFSVGVPEKIIQKNTGHRSLDSLRVYERISDEQHQETCKILTSLENVQSSSMCL